MSNSPGGWWRLFLWACLFGVAIYVIRHIMGTLTVFGLGFFLAYFLNRPVERITGSRLGPIKSLSRLQAILVIYLILLAVLITAGAILVPIAVDQATAIVSGAPETVEKVKEMSEAARNRYMSSVPPQVRTNLEDALEGSTAQLTDTLRNVLTWVGGSVLDAINKVLLFFTGLLVAIYFLVGWHDLGESFFRMFPYTYRDDARSLTAQMNRIFSGYVRATLVSSACCGALTFILMLALTLWAPNPYSLLLAFVAGITYAIPVIGMIGTIGLSAILAYLSSGSIAYAVAVALAAALGNQVIDRTIYPKLMGDAIGVSALFILFAAFAGGEFLGTTGMLLGVPLAAIAKALVVWFHARFLVVPEDEAHHSTQELWKRAAELPRQAQRVDSAWAGAAHTPGAAELAHQTGVALQAAIVTEEAHLAELHRAQELAHAAERSASEAESTRVIAPEALAARAHADRAAAEQRAAAERAAAEAKAAEDLRRAEEARKLAEAEEARKLAEAEEARKLAEAEEARKLAEERRRAEALEKAAAELTMEAESSLTRREGSLAQSDSQAQQRLDAPSAEEPTDLPPSDTRPEHPASSDSPPAGLVAEADRLAAEAASAEKALAEARAQKPADPPRKSGKLGKMARAAEKARAEEIARLTALAESASQAAREAREQAEKLQARAVEQSQKAVDAADQARARQQARQAEELEKARMATVEARENPAAEQEQRQAEAELAERAREEGSDPGDVDGGIVGMIG